VEYARRIALAKAQGAAREIHEEAIILGADTVVWMSEGEPPFGKPRDREHAADMLKAISQADGHLVTTAYALVDTRRDSGATVHPLVEHETTAVYMRPLSDETLESYLATDEWTDKAGGYGIQRGAAGLVRRIEGSYTNVAGLPVAQVIEALERLRAFGPRGPGLTGG
jgi:septum formation protein